MLGAFTLGMFVPFATNLVSFIQMLMISIIILSKSQSGKFINYIILYIFKYLVSFFLLPFQTKGLMYNISFFQDIFFLKTRYKIGH